MSIKFLLVNMSLQILLVVRRHFSKPILNQTCLSTGVNGVLDWIF